MNENLIYTLVTTLLMFISFRVGKRKSTEYVVESTRVGISAGVYLLARWLGSAVDTKFFEDEGNAKFKKYTKDLQKFALGEIPESTFEIMFSPEVMQKVKELEDISWSVSGAKDPGVTHKALKDRIQNCEIMEGMEIADELTT
jgi:hypothetical protein